MRKEKSTKTPQNGNKFAKFQLMTFDEFDIIYSAAFLCKARFEKWQRFGENLLQRCF